jgi:hypothetical protein
MARDGWASSSIDGISLSALEQGGMMAKSVNLRALRSSLLTRLAGIAAISAFAVLTTHATAAETEIRDFQVTVDGKKAGDYRMTIERLPDGSLSMAGQATVNVKYLVYRYQYSYQGKEIWRAGRLLQLNSRAFDDGKNYALEAVAQGDGLLIEANGHRFIERSPVWTTTYWQLPDPRYREPSLTLLDADTGRILHGRWQAVGQESVRVAGHVQICSHFALSTDRSKADLWYDGEDRLVRQDSVEDGHRTVLSLVRLQR